MDQQASKSCAARTMIQCSKQDLSKKSKDELVDDLYDSLVENEKLKRELRKYKNPNTPSSANKHLKPNTQGLKVRAGSKRGAPFNHPGTNRPKKIDGEPMHITTDQCPRCKSNDIDVLRGQKQQIEDIPQVIEPTITDVERDVCKCNNCLLQFVARDGKTPIKGKFGINLMVLVLFLRFIVRGVFRKTCTFLSAGLTFRITPASIQTIIERAAGAAEKEYERLKQNVRNSQIVYADETSFSVMGMKWWVWIFRTDHEKLLVIRYSRGNNVLEEVLGKAYCGVLVCDCWRAYDFLSNALIQRCWAHLLRKSELMCDTVAGKHFHEKLSVLFDEIKRYNQYEHSALGRLRKYNQMTAELQKITAYYVQYENCQKVVKYIDFHIESWFTCVKIAGVEPTNNFAEQAIRETVLVRKIIGAFRSIKGVQAYETLASLLATWQFQERDIKRELHRMLSTNLC